MIQIPRTESGLVVVAKQTGNAALTDELDAIFRIRAIAHDIAETHNPVDPFPINGFQDRFQSGQVAVDVRDQSYAQEPVSAPPLGIKGTPDRS